ncbi:hypothetical protein WN48_10323 [Eufriesea mexicana]|uniref:Uncharacterized protein n=1 Tax=Eufriesea mexicana TaxID=516756 RepID=A0A310SMR6_9HYME|nr:hypothetical protein WN48_10323 [Eufriesea mexicana]
MGTRSVEIGVIDDEASFDRIETLSKARGLDDEEHSSVDGKRSNLYGYSSVTRRVLESFVDHLGLTDFLQIPLQRRIQRTSTHQRRTKDAPCSCSANDDHETSPTKPPKHRNSITPSETTVTSCDSSTIERLPRANDSGNRRRIRPREEPRTIERWSRSRRGSRGSSTDHETKRSRNEAETEEKRNKIGIKEETEAEAGADGAGGKRRINIAKNPRIYYTLERRSICDSDWTSLETHWSPETIRKDGQEGVVAAEAESKGTGPKITAGYSND